MVAKWFQHVFLLLFCIGCSWTGAMAKQEFTAMYVFGDSLSDPGNNLNFHTTLTKANYFPYGIDFPDGPTGRWTNGKLLVDYLVEFAGLPLLPAYANPSTKGKNILFGVNYASAGAGILEDSGRILGSLFSFSEQIQNFKNTLNQLRDQMAEEEMSQYLAKALVVLAISSNDYDLNYLLPVLSNSSLLYSPDEYADILVKTYKGYILELHSWGLRKFFIVDVPPIGCTPFFKGAGRQCATGINDIVEKFNSQLKSLVYHLNSDFTDSKFTYGSAFQWLFELRDNSTAYGLTVIDKGCCRLSNIGLEIVCLPLQIPCTNRDQYIFWDFVHPSQAANRIIAKFAYNAIQQTYA